MRVACANELGLGNPLQAQPASLSQSGYRPRGLDLTDQQCDQMTAFIASLPLPREVIPSSAAEAARSVAGKKHFKQIGCINCHTADVAEAQGIYSDLLLHEMGEGLGGGGGGFYGEEPSDPSAEPDIDGGSTSPSEWRTPPLWGVADSAPIFTTAEQPPWPRPSSCTPVKRRRPRIASRVSPMSSKKS